MRMKRIFLITLLLIITFTQNVFASDDIDYRIVKGADLIGNDYSITIKVGSHKNAGTDGVGVRVKFVFHDGTKSFELDDPDKDDLEKNKTCKYTVRINKPQYMLREVILENKSTDGLQVKSVSVHVNGNDIYSKSYPDGKWVEGDDDEHDDYISILVAEKMKRNISNIGNFNSVFNNIVYLEEGVTPNSEIVNFNWNGIISDQYKSNYVFNSINHHVPKVSIDLLGNGKEKSVSKYADYAKDIRTGADVSGFSINKQEVYTNMLKDKINKLTFTPKLTLISASTKPYNGSHEVKGEVQVIRKNFAIKNVRVMNQSESFKAFTNNYYFNSQSNYIMLELEVSNTGNNDNYSAQDIAKNISGDIRLYYNKNDEDYLVPIHKNSENNKVILAFEVPKDKNDDNSFLKLKMTGVTSKSNNVDGFKLLNEEGIYEETVTFNLSEYKIDTQAPIIKSDDLELVGSDTRDWAKSIEFNVEAEETIFVRNSLPRGEGYFTYRLYDKVNFDKKGENTNAISIKSNGIKGSNNSYDAPSSASTKVRIELNNKEEGEYVLALSGHDFAGNRALKIYRDIKLDNKAPNISVTATEKSQNTVDKTRSTEYKFTINDASETGVVYYCFVKEGDPIPAFTSGVKASGTIDSVIGQWAYIEQKDSPTTTVLLKIAEGTSFKGRLYYFSIDAFGNSTVIDNLEERTGNKNVDYNTGYYFRDINFDNSLLNYELIVGPYSYSLSNYDIRFEHAADVTIKYRWKDYTQTQLYKGQNIGSAVQFNGTNNEVLLNGPCILEYTVSNTSGNYAIYTKEFIFDNKAPTVSVSVRNSGTISNSHTFTLFATDYSGIKNALYYLVAANANDINNPDFKFAEDNATINNGIVNTSINIENVESGAYILVFMVEDYNGSKSVAQSTTVYFRSSAPAVNVDIYPDDKYNDFYVNTENYYNITLDVYEPVIAADMFLPRQYVKYRVSEDGVNYSAWMNGEELRVAYGDIYNDEEALYTIVEIYSPIALNEGENTLYIQVANASFTDNLAFVLPNMIVNLEPIKIYYDPNGPEYSLYINDIETNRNVTGTLIIQDTLTNNEDMTLEAMSMYIDISEPMIDPLTGLENKYIITIYENDSTAIIARDRFGNETLIPINVWSVDRIPPEISFYAENGIFTEYIGERKEVWGRFFVDGAVEKETRFALVDFDEEVSEDDYDESSSFLSVVLESSNEFFNGTSNSTYLFRVRGTTGKYKIAVNAKDQVGNETTTYITPIEVEDALAEIKTYRLTYDEVLNNASVLINFNVPVYILPKHLEMQGEYKEKEKIDLADLDEINENIARSYATNYSMKYVLVAPENDTYKLYAADECGRTYTFEVTVSGVKFEEESLYELVLKDALGDIIDINGFYNINSGLELHISSIDNNKYVLIPIESYNVYTTKLTEDDPEAFEGEIEYLSLVTTESAIEGEIEDLSSVTTGSAIEAEIQGVVKAVDISWLSEITQDFNFTGGSVSTIPGEDFYSTLNYYPYDNNNLDKRLYFILREYEFDGEEYIWKRDVLESIAINCFDITKPIIKYSLSTNEFTLNEVVISLNAYDNESGIESLKYHLCENEYCYEHAFIDVVDGEVVVEENSYLHVTATNRAEIEESITIQINNIVKEDIEFGKDFTVSYIYCYQDINGNWIETNSEDGIHYKKVRAIINFIKPNHRGLYVLNNLGSNERILTALDKSFEFIIADQYGNEESYVVSAEKFDIAAPSISDVIYDKRKTNVDVTVNFTISDDIGISKVTIQQKNVDPDPIEIGNDTGSYDYTISESGTYTITAYDIVGNKATKSFVISNIDKEEPYVLDIVRSTDLITNKSVTVKITGYTKPGVTIIGTEVIDDSIDTKDYQVSISNNLITFTKNGKIKVIFKDEYGNQGYEVIEVTNIYSVPPKLVAISELSGDNLSIIVSFEMDPSDTFRSISDLYVSYSGIVYNATEAQFTLVDNGKYVFKVFDDAGMMQYIELEVVGIDKTAPIITQVSWSYYYYNEVLNDWVLLEDSRVPADEQAYIVATDLYPITNKNVIVKVTTNKQTVYVGGSKDAEFRNNHELEYNKNGLFNFNLKSVNGLSTSYGVDIEVIDKTAPVLELANPIELTFIQGGTDYDKNILLDYTAYDIYKGVTTDLYEKVIIDWGSFDPDNINNNIFDRNKPYYITYKVYDKAQNFTEVRRTIRLVGFDDIVTLVNGKLPDATSSIILDGNSIDMTILNFSGTAYVKYATGRFTMGQMKTRGTVISENGGKYSLKNLSEGWYTIYIQTDKRDYIVVNVYVSGLDK